MDIQSVTSYHMKSGVVWLCNVLLAAQGVVLAVWSTALLTAKLPIWLRLLRFETEPVGTRIIDKFGMGS